MWDDEDLPEKIAEIREGLLNHAGQLAAIQCVMFTLIETHPDPQAFFGAVKTHLERYEAVLLGGARSEVALKKFQEIRESVLRHPANGARSGTG